MFVIVCKASSGPFSSQNLINKFLRCFLVKTSLVVLAPGPWQGGVELILHKYLRGLLCNMYAVCIILRWTDQI